MRKPMVLGAFALLSVSGIAVIALPDTGPRVEFSQAHGPGPLDGVGIALLVLGSAILWWYLWAHRGALHQSPSRLRSAWVFSAGLGIGMVLASVAGDFAGWWVVGAAVLTAVQLSLFFSVRPA